MTRIDKFLKTLDSPLIQKQIEVLSSLFTNTHLRKEYLTFVVENLKVWSGCKCVGIRVINEDWLMPYEAFVGFTYDFWEHENLLSIKEHQCACIRVVTGEPDAIDEPIITPNGSLWTNDLQAFGKTIPKECFTRYRGKCIESGFSTLAVIPIRNDGKVIGIIHLADIRKDKLPFEKVSLLESVSVAIGEIILQFITEDRNNEKKEVIKQQLTHIKDFIGVIKKDSNPSDLHKKLDILTEMIETIAV